MGITQKFTEVKADIQRLSRSVNNKITDLKSDMALDKVEEVKAISEQAKTDIETRKNSALKDITSKTENSIQGIQSSVNETTSSALEQIETKKNNGLSEIETTTNDCKTELSKMVSTANIYKENAKTYSEQAKNYAEQAKNIADGSIYATKDDLLANQLPPNTIIQRNDPTIDDSNYKICDGSNVSPDDYPSLLSTDFVKFYRLCNLTRSTYDDGGNITFRFFHNDLWTTDPDICKKKNPDLRNLYRRLRYRGDDDLGGATKYDYILNRSLTDYQLFGENYNFINVQEELTMTNGVITSASEFYDGEYRVELTEFVKTSAITGDSLNYINKYDYKDYNAVASTTQGNTETNKGYYIEGATKQKPHYYFFSNAETDRKISDNQYLTWCVDGKFIGFNDGTDGSTVYKDVTHKVTSTTYTEATPCTIMFDFITPPSFVAGRDIFHGYRSLIFRIADATGKLNMYMAGYKSSNALKWKASNVFTGYKLEPNRKYRLVYKCDGYFDSSTTMYHYLRIYQYDETETSFASLDCDTTGKFGEGHYELNYLPYNYYSSYGMRTLYHADATAWTQGLFIDLLSLRIQHVGDTTFQNYGNEFRMAKLYYQDPVDNGLALPRITGVNGCESYIKVK